VDSLKIGVKDRPAIHRIMVDAERQCPDERAVPGGRDPRRGRAGNRPIDVGEFFAFGV
jgi:hypothetical protein